MEPKKILAFAAAATTTFLAVDYVRTRYVINNCFEQSKKGNKNTIGEISSFYRCMVINFPFEFKNSEK
jgi:hypothetical protein